MPKLTFRNLLGVALALCGIGAAVLTLAARRADDWELAHAGAVASIVLAVLMAIFLVPPLARAARKETSRFNLPVQLTGGGAVFLGIYAVVAFAAWNTGNNLLFLIFSLMTAMLFVDWAAGRSTLRDLAVSARFPDHIYAGETAPVLVTLHNVKRVLPSFSVLVEYRRRPDEVGVGAQRRRQRFEKSVLAHFVYVPRRSKVEQRVEQTFQRRGLLLISGFVISTRFPFGFLRLRRRLRARDLELVIFPKLEPADDELNLLPVEAGKLPAVRRGAGQDLHSLRDYQPRDDVRHVDWKATARNSRLIVREFTEEEERRVSIALDTLTCEGDGKDLPERFERGVTLAASFAAHFIEEKAEVRLIVGNESGPFGVGREHLHSCLRRLALVTHQAVPGVSSEREKILEGAFSFSPRGGQYAILLTTARPGTLPAHVWRRSHVVHL